MPTIDDLSQSKYLKQSDVTPDLTVTIRGNDYVNMAKDGEPADMKYCLLFENDVKPLSLNKTNGELIALNLGDKDLDNWVGKQITLYADPTIMCKGKRTGGIRVRYEAPAAAPSAPPQDHTQPPADDIPF